MDKKEYNELLEQLKQDLFLYLQIQLKSNKKFISLIEEHIKKEVKKQIKRNFI